MKRGPSKGYVQTNPHEALLVVCNCVEKAETDIFTTAISKSFPSVSNKLNLFRCNWLASQQRTVRLLAENQIIPPTSHILLEDATSLSRISGTLSHHILEIVFQALVVGVWLRQRRLTAIPEAASRLLQINSWPISTVHQSTTQNRSGPRRQTKEAGQLRDRRRAVRTTSSIQSEAWSRSLSQCKNFYPRSWLDA